MTLADKDFPSSKAFDEINEVLKDEETRKELIKSANAVFAFDLTSPDGNKKVANGTYSMDIDGRRVGILI